MRIRSALSRPMLRHHPRHVAWPEEFRLAEWERRFPNPAGYALGEDGRPALGIDRERIPAGIQCHNIWRRGRGGRAPSLERIFRNILDRAGGVEPRDELLLDLLEFLQQGDFIRTLELFGARDSLPLLQVNADVLRLEFLDETTRRRCEVCGDPRPFTEPGAPCSRCHGRMVAWKDDVVGQNRQVKRILRGEVRPLHAGEYTAQITTVDRAELEEQFRDLPRIAVPA